MDVRDLLSPPASPPIRQQEPEKKADQAPAERELREVAPGFYVSPLLKFDTEVSTLIFQVRDGESGEVERQFPSESRLEILKHSASGEDAAEEREAPTEPQTDSVGAEQRVVERPTRESGASTESRSEPAREADTARQMTHGAASGPGQPTDTSPVDLTA